MSKSYEQSAKNEVLPQLLAKRGQTAKELGVESIKCHLLAKAGVIKSIDTLKTGKRGRPAHIYALTDKGRKQAKRLVAA